MRFKGLLLGVVLIMAAHYGSAAEVVGTIYELESLFIKQQYQFLPVSPPSEEVYVHTYDTIVPVDWKKFPNTFTSLMYAQMDENGYPTYKVSIYEDPITRETVFLNSYGIEAYRLKPEKDYDPFLWAKTTFDISSELELDPLSQWIFDPAHIAAEITLIPEVFHEDYLLTQAAVAAEEAVLVDSSEQNDGVSVSMSLVPADMAFEFSAESEVLDGIMMAMESTPPPPPSGGGTNDPPGGGSSNLVVELALSLPEGFGDGYIEIFSKDDLILSTDWTLEDDWVPTYGAETVYWTDYESSNKMERFYYINDGADQDGDGRSDIYEAWNGTASNSYNHVDSDSDGMHDWWEEKLFGDLSQDSDDDYDGDGLLNNEELIPGHPPVMITDPSLYSSDGDALGDAEMYASPPTDPWNPDTSTPVATISWPTNNTVLAF